MLDKIKKIFAPKILLGLGVGAASGFAYYYFVGCSGGSCPIQSNPWISTTYGGIFGLLLVMDSKKKKEKKQE